MELSSRVNFPYNTATDIVCHQLITIHQIQFIPHMEFNTTANVLELFHACI